MKWERIDEGYKVYVKVPFDSNAVLRLPDVEKEIVLQKGEHIIIHPSK